MALTPQYHGDDFFNESVAKAAFDMVMAMDEDEARAFTTAVVADTVWETIEKNQRTLQSHLSRVVTKRNQALSKAAENNPELSELISKAPRNPYYYGYVFDESDFNRDPKTGQFRKKVTYTAKPRKVNDRAARSLGLPTKRDAESKASYKSRNGRQVKGKVGDTNLAYYQQGHAQVANFLEDVRQTGLDAGDVDIIVGYRDTHTGERYSRRVNTTQASDIPINPASERFEYIEAKPSNLNVGGASFGLVSALGGSERRANMAGQTMNRIDRNSGEFVDSWLDSGDVYNSNSRLYDRVASGSHFLGQVAPAGTKLQIAAAFGEFAGKQGPQAEKVIGPKARRTMYRYRGTEKTPDTELRREYDKAMRSPTNLDGSEAGTLAQRVATAYLARKVPSQRLYELNLKSGHTPPSEGVIIGPDGKLITQAIGYGDDHYLPFNLKNLKGLRGGEYIRTRSVGGPTTEDIYAGLVTGAKRITVVSRSGMFVVEFDDTFRGTRRYNDKAARMVDRYAKILDAVKSEDVTRAPLERSVRQAIIADVEQMSWLDARGKQQEIKRRIDEAKSYPRFTAEDEAFINRKVAEHVRNAGALSETEETRLRSQLRNDIMESKAYNFRLNGDGYAAAIKALQEQFPYYLKEPFYAPRKDLGVFETEVDQGYVKPRYNRPEKALEGFYDVSVAGGSIYTDAKGNATGKFGADKADYQNHRFTGTRVLTPKGEGELIPTEGAKRPTAPGADDKPTPEEAAADQLERSKHVRSQAAAATELRSWVSARITDPEDRKAYDDWIGLDEGEFATWFKNAANARKFENDVEDLHRRNSGERELSSMVTRYKAAKELVGGENWDSSRHLDAKATAPAEFPGRAYRRGGDRRLKEDTLKKLAADYPIPGMAPLDQLSDDDFKTALGEAQSVREIAGEIANAKAEGTPAQAMLQALHNDGKVDSLTDRTTRFYLEPAAADELVEGVHRAWRLRRNLDAMAEQAKTPTGTNTPEIATTAASRGENVDWSTLAPTLIRDADLTINQLVRNSRPKKAEELRELRDDLFAAVEDEGAQPGDAELAGKALHRWLADNPDVHELMMKDRKPKQS